MNFLNSRWSSELSKLVIIPQCFPPGDTCPPPGNMYPWGYMYPQRYMYPRVHMYPWKEGIGEL